jgi:hypothetical protein
MGADRRSAAHPTFWLSGATKLLDHGIADKCRRLPEGFALLGDIWRVAVYRNGRNVPVDESIAFTALAAVDFRPTGTRPRSKAFPRQQWAASAR